jgi:polyphosphate kinase
MKKNNKESIDEIKKLKSPTNYFNRELSLIEFQKRVLAEAEDASIPLLERLKFVCIVSSNLDEFFMIRVAGLKSQKAAGLAELSYDGKNPEEQLVEIRKMLDPLYKRQEQVLMNEILPLLEKYNIKIHSFSSTNDEEKEYLAEYFDECILPVLTPLSIGPANPFPRLLNRSLNIAFVLNDKSQIHTESSVAFMQVPVFLPRFIRLNRNSGDHFVLIEDIIIAFADRLFPGYSIQTANSFRVTRDADIEIAEDEAEDLLTEMAEQIKLRDWGRAAVRLEINENMPSYLSNLLMNSLELQPIDVFRTSRPLNLSDFMQLYKLPRRNLKDKPFISKKIAEFEQDDKEIFKSLSNKEILVHHPFETFSSSTAKLLDISADDPDVYAIKITLYRTGMNSDIVSALKRAAEKGKYVTAFVELKARFDEEKNILWARELEHAGAHVVYGVPGLKTHCKIAIVVRKENNKFKTYLHLSTGNYNQITARLYTDIGFFTTNKEFIEDAHQLFNMLTGYSRPEKWNHLVVAPSDLYNTLIDKINREIEKSTPENPGQIIIKTNSLAHRELIPALYRASNAGVKIKLLVRGICCLKPGVEGISENISVKSTIGRFLEHTRIFYFKNGGEEEYYLSSADWMSRNMHRRVETMFPVLDKNIQTHLKHILDIYLKDNIKSWILNTDGDYVKTKPEGNRKPISAQQFFLNSYINDY